jgi:TIR domain
MADRAEPETPTGPADSEQAARAFISYASQDKPVADAVCQALERAGMACWIAPRNVVPGESACGQSYFTWNAFRIECDPQSVLKTVQAFDLRSADVREGAAYRESNARGSGTLARKAGGLDSAIFSVEMPVDPDAFRRARAESDVVVGDIMKKPVSLDAALSLRATEIISGTISIVFETDSVGHVRRRMKVTKLDIKGPDGPSETETVTETVERRLISRHD